MRAPTTSPLALSLLLAFLPLAAPAADESLVITELMANNRSFLADADKDSPDWVEIFNAGDQEVNLEGWFLTDTPKKLDRWAFPAKLLAPGRFLVVFCSGKDRTDPAGELHTNFKMAKEGSTVLLVTPDRTVASAWAFPEQAPNTSYGANMESSTTTVLPASAPARVFVPADASLAGTWTAPDFDDSGWTAGATAIGFGVRTDAIGLDVQAAMEGKNTSIYIRGPFEVADPNAIASLTLSMAYSDAFVAFLNGTEVARRNTPVTVNWNSASSRVHDPTVPEEIDLSSSIPGLKAGRNLLAIQGLDRAATTDVDFFILPEIDALSVTHVYPDDARYFDEPTPGRPNKPGFTDIAPRPAFSEESRAFTQAATVALTSPLEGSVIRYTTDGKLPIATSQPYSEPIPVAGTVKISARVFKDGYMPGFCIIKVYTVVNTALKDFKSNLPIMIVTTLGKGIGDYCGGGAYTPGAFMLIEPGADGYAHITDPAIMAESAQYRKRGSSTCGNPKFAFNVQVLDELGLEKDVQTFDFPEDSDYIMHGSTEYDKSLMHNPFAYWLSREMGQWAPRTHFVEAFFQGQAGVLNNSTNYFGIYQWMEKIKRGPGRVDVEQLNLTDAKEPAIAGGYIMKKDRVGSEEDVISVGTGADLTTLVLTYPKIPPTGAVRTGYNAQKAWITAFTNKMILTLNPNEGSQADNELIDFIGWIDHHIVNFYPKNVDAFRLSGYMFKHRSGRFVMGPPWDYDRSMGGVAIDTRPIDPTGWGNNGGDGGTLYFQSGGMGGFYGRLFKEQPPLTDTPFNRAYKARWRELRRGPLSTEHMMEQLDAWAADLDPVSARNSAKWTWQRPEHGGNFLAEIEFLKSWLTQRAVWIDTQFVPLPVLSPKGGNINAGDQVTMTIDSGSTIYYTLDGTDPKGANNQPSANAIAYTGPVTIDRNVRIIARAFDGVTWSGTVKETYIVEVPRIMITEIMYNAPAPTDIEDPEKKFTATKMEFVELKNVGTKSIPLTGVRFTRGLSFQFTSGSSIDHLEPGQIAVIVANRDAFTARYGSNGAVIGQYVGSLSDLSQRITLAGSLDETIFDFTYNAAWIPETAGQGYSLVNADPEAPPADLGTAARWRRSAGRLGSPGADDAVAGMQIPGDVTGDGRVGMPDVMVLLLHLLEGGVAVPCGGSGGGQKTLDWDGNGVVALNDAIWALK